MALRKITGKRATNLIWTCALSDLPRSQTARIRKDAALNVNNDD